MDVHLRDLRYFVAVAEHLHFTRAAEALFVSQPSLSKQIHMLEAQLRAPLFVRNRRTVELTPVGDALLPRARAMLAEWDQTTRELAAASAVQDATLVVGFSTGVGRGRLPTVRARLAERMPDVSLRMRQVPWDDSTGGLAASGPERSDAAFVWLPLTDPDSYDWLDVSTEPSLLALPAGHPLAAREHIDFHDLLDEPFLALPPSSGRLREHWLAADSRHGRPIRIGAEISNTDETVEALTAGLGVCLVAAGNAELIARDGVAIRPVSGIESSQLVFAWRRGDSRPLLVELRTAVLEAVTATRDNSS
jgi:DNA-binding transcriptional LysR family regulator